MMDREHGKKRLVRVAIAVGLGIFASCAPSDDPETRVDLEGIWSGPFTSQEAQAWALEDFACFAGCPPVAREAMTTLLDDARSRLEEYLQSAPPAESDNLQAVPIDALLQIIRVVMGKTLHND